MWMNILEALIPIFISISMSSPMLYYNGLNILLCKNKYRLYAGCKSVHFDSEQLRCGLIFGTNKEERIFKVQHDKSSVECSSKDRMVYDRHGTLRCVKAFKRINKEPRKRGKVRKPPDKLTAEQNQSCILHRRENITCTPQATTIKLPLRLMAGMKMTLSGIYISKGLVSDISFTKGEDNAVRNMMNWFHINLRWSERRLVFVNGFKLTDFEGDFPIKEPSYFSLTMELAQSVTKIYLDGVLVKRFDVTIGLKELSVLKYSKIYLLLVQKTSDGCETGGR